MPARARLAQWLRAHALWLPSAAHLLISLWLFAGLLFEGRMLFFRDLSFYYYPNYVFLSRALAQGVWPLWNPTSDAGAPFLMAYPLDLLLVFILGARGTLAVGPPLHIWLAMCGATRLARAAGTGAWGAWAAGLFYGSSGFLLSSVNLSELFHAAAWAPWVVAAIHGVATAPSRRRILVLALVSAVQVTTLSGEIVVQTALAGLLLMPALPRMRSLAGLAAAAALAALLAVPVLLGAWTLVQGTRREGGIPAESAFAGSVRGPVLLEAFVPRFFGNVHSFSDQGYWGQPFFPSEQPYLLSLYVGVPVLLLAVMAGPRRGRWWLLVALGVLLALGRYGPLAWTLAPFMKVFRTPAKFLFLADLGLCVLAGFGIDQTCRSGARRLLWAIAPGATLATLGLCLMRWGDLPARALGDLVPPLTGDQARAVADQVWPGAFLASGALATAVGVVLAFAPRLAPIAAVLAGLDLLAVNGGINPAASASFYALQPDLKKLIDTAVTAGPFRWFSYGIANSPPLTWRAPVWRQNSDVWLYYLDRQSLVPRTHVLDGLEGAFDEDRVGWAPAGSTLDVPERTPRLYARHHARLRQANVRWVVTFHDLPRDLVTPHGEAALPGVVEPVRIYELNDPLPRAYWVPRAEIIADGPALQRRLADRAYDPRQSVLLADSVPGSPPIPTTPGTVVFERLDPETVRLRSAGPPGWLVVLEGFHPNWRARSQGGPVPLLRANGRYWALPTPGGDQVITVRYQPPWRTSAVVASGLAGLAALGLAAVPLTGRRRFAGF